MLLRGNNVNDDNTEEKSLLFAFEKKRDKKMTVLETLTTRKGNTVFFVLSSISIPFPFFHLLDWPGRAAKLGRERK